MKTQLSKLDKVKQVLGIELQLAEMMTKDGQATLEAEVFEAGAAVFIKTEDDQQIALPVGEYELENDMILVVQEEGVIAEIKEMEAEAEAEEAPEEEAVAAEEAPDANPVPKKVVESVSKETHFSKHEREAFISEITELKAQIAELTKEETQEEATEDEAVELAEAIVPNPENQKEIKLTKLAPNRKLGISDRVLSHINNNK